MTQASPPDAARREGLPLHFFVYYVADFTLPELRIRREAVPKM